MAVLNHTYPFYTTSKGHGKHLKLRMCKTKGCTIGNLKLSLGFQVMKSTSLSWSFVYRNVRCGNEWTIDALRLKHKILISDVSSSST